MEHVVPFIRSVVDRFAETVRGLQTEALRVVPHTGLQRIVIRVADCPIKGVTDEIGPQWPASAVDDCPVSPCINGIFSEGTARWRARCHLRRLAQAQAKLAIAGVAFKRIHKSMPLTPHIANAQHRFGTELPLNRKVIILGVWGAIINRPNWNSV